ncbi:MAG: hypothetical protein AAF206_28705 [Bacteroidota bacterium]
MSKTTKRNISVDGRTYTWTLKGNRIDGDEQMIRVHEGRNTKSILYIDPYPWDFEIRPQAIVGAIRFALKQGWKPQEANHGLAISMEEGAFCVIPKRDTLLR